MKILVLLFSFLLVDSLDGNDSKTYVKNYNDRGELVEEGWMQGAQKQGYWKNYENNSLVSAGPFTNGKKNGYWHYFNNNLKTMEGRYRLGNKTDWWTCYATPGFKKVKKQYLHNELHGYALFYKRKLVKVEEFQNNSLQGAWSSLSSFKKAHPDFSYSDLR